MSTDSAEDIPQQLLQDIERNALALPALPDIAIRVRDAVNGGTCSVGEISRIIATDAALSARLIQVANTPLFRTDIPIESLEKAVECLGMNRLRDMVTNLVMEQLFHAPCEPADKKLRELWEHSLTVAAISHVLAAHFTRLAPEEAMLAGLVHGIGALPLLIRAGDYPGLLEKEAALELALAKLQARLGTVLLEAWNFPAALQTVPAQHENLARDSAQTDYVDVVTVANLQSYIGSEHPLAQADWSKVPAFAKLGLSPEVNLLESEKLATAIREAQRLLAP
ncbi:MAG TPA: HDOD domain-containing protein [Gammaproteobacteria bacterium]|jgi:HD-like signal output (HDOD) protein